MVKSLGVGGPLEYTVSFLGQVIIIVIGRPRSLTIVIFAIHDILVSGINSYVYEQEFKYNYCLH